MAPEMRKGSYTSAVDVFAFGMIMWQMITREPLFKGVPAEFRQAKIEKGERPAIPSWCPLEIQKLIESCWKPEDMRLKFSEIGQFLSIMTENMSSFPSLLNARSFDLGQKIFGAEREVDELGKVQIALHMKDLVFQVVLTVEDILITARYITELVEPESDTLCIKLNAQEVLKMLKAGKKTKEITNVLDMKVKSIDAIKVNIVVTNFRIQLMEYPPVDGDVQVEYDFILQSDVIEFGRISDGLSSE